jgi:hypothetical protein
VGAAVIEVLDRHGVWKRAGLYGLITGLDLAEALASLPDGLDRDFARRLLIAAESGFVPAYVKKTAEDSPAQNPDADNAAAD